MNVKNEQFLAISLWENEFHFYNDLNSVLQLLKIVWHCLPEEENLYLMTVLIFR